MQGHMLTEDIDSTLRAFAAGAKMVHELNTVSYEQAPTTVQAFLKQRLRWAQGWFQVTIRHSTLAARQGAPGANIKSRLGIFVLLVFRELFFYILTQFSALLLGNFVVQPPKNIAAIYHSLFGYPLSSWILCYNVLTLVIITGFTIRNRSEFTSWVTICVYGAGMPIYFTILAAMGLFAHFRELTKYEKWNPTKYVLLHHDSQPILTLIGVELSSSLHSHSFHSSIVYTHLTIQSVILHPGACPTRIAYPETLPGW